MMLLILYKVVIKMFRYCYWKVYNNYDKAIKIFKKYDEVRNKIIDDIMKGIPLDKIIRNINSYNLN